jgi:3-methyladenine DNA glycosylase AlkD
MSMYKQNKNKQKKKIVLFCEMEIENRLLDLRDKNKAEILQWFFKTNKGQYGEGDKFLGIVVPKIRKIAKEFEDTSFDEIEKLLKSEWHEFRLTALIILVYKFKKTKDKKNKKDIYDFYLKNTKYINNWDLVDLTARDIVGGYLLDKDRKVLYKLAKSKNLWEKRIAIISTFEFIRNMDFIETIKISEILLADKHDLIHKAVGWMLREVGKRDEALLREFLDKHKTEMPRTCLRYSIEKLSEIDRKYYLKK